MSYLPVIPKALLCLSVFWVFTFSSSLSLALDVVVATGINDDRPYVYGDEKISSQFPGVTIDILKLIETKYDVNFIIQKEPWKRVVSLVKSNKIDGGFHFSFKEKRKSFVAYPIPQGQHSPDPRYSISNRSYTIYRLKGNTIHWDGEQFIMGSKKKIELGAIRGGSITDDIIRLGHELNEVSNDQQLLELLLLKRVDAFVALENMLDPKIKRLVKRDRSRIEKAYPPVVNKPYYIGFSKQFYKRNTELAWNIWNTIDSIRNNGELEKIYDKYAQK